MSTFAELYDAALPGHATILSGTVIFAHYRSRLFTQD
jgi:hypothetical protein